MHFISCHETGIACTPWGWKEKEGESKRRWVLAEGEIGRKKKLWSIESCYFIPISYSIHLCIFMNTSSGKLHFWGPHTSDVFLRPGCVILLGSRWWREGEKRHKLKKEQKEGGGGEQSCGTVAMSYSPVTWSTRMREVMMRPYWEKSCSSSFWVMVFGKPLTYKFASLMEAELGRA